MDFLDSLDLDTIHKKCHRVRSWYLYEQYKSLEENQLDAAQRLKNKSYQEKILRQELKERRERRRLCDQIGLCQSESRLEKTLKSEPSKALLGTCADDRFESFCEFHEAYELNDYEDDISHDGSQTSKKFYEFASVDLKKDNSESVISVIKSIKNSDNLADDVKGELEIVKKNIAENINLQLETVKENIECLEKFTTLANNDKIREIDSLDLFEQCESDINVVKPDQKYNVQNEKNFISTWSKFVTFAYETVQLNHGDILQPYVSPIKYATSDSDISVESCKCVKRKTSICFKKCPKTCVNAERDSYNKKDRKLRWVPDRGCQSENSKYSFDNRHNEMKSREKYTRGRRSSGKSASSVLPEQFSPDKFSEESVCKCRCLENIANRVLQLTHYIESILQDGES